MRSPPCSSQCQVCTEAGHDPLGRGGFGAELGRKHGLERNRGHWHIVENGRLPHVVRDQRLQRGVGVGPLLLEPTLHEVRATTGRQGDVRHSRPHQPADQIALDRQRSPSTSPTRPGRRSDRVAAPKLRSRPIPQAFVSRAAPIVSHVGAFRSYCVRACSRRFTTARTTTAVLAQSPAEHENDEIVRQKTHHAINPLSEQDSLLAAANGVAGELDAMPRATAAVFYVEHLAVIRSVRETVGGPSRFRGERSHERWLQGAVSGDVRIFGLPENICTPLSEGL